MPLLSVPFQTKFFAGLYLFGLSQSILWIQIPQDPLLASEETMGEGEKGV